MFVQRIKLNSRDGFYQLNTDASQMVDILTAYRDSLEKLLFEWQAEGNREDNEDLRANAVQTQAELDKLLAENTTRSLDL